MPNLLTAPRALLLSFLLLVVGAAPSPARSEGSYLGIFMQDRKIGYSSSRVSEEKVGGQTMRRTVSLTVMDLGMLGQRLNTTIQTTTVSTLDGQPRQMQLVVTSSGRTQNIEANFVGNQIHVVVDNNGALSRKTLTVPPGGRVVDDPVAAIAGDSAVGESREIFVLDPLTADLVKNTVTFVGPTPTTLDGRPIEARLITVSEPRATMRIFTDPKGDLIKVEGPMGMLMLPMSREQALADVGVDDRPIDLAEATLIRPDKPLGSIASIDRLLLRISGPDLNRVPSDSRQTVKADGDAWIVDLRRVEARTGPSARIAAARRDQPEWAKPSMLIPSDTARFRNLASRVVGSAETTVDAGRRVATWVFANMRSNSGIGVLRDASEVLDSREGLCRDHAVLCAAILRAAGVPTRLASGLVYQDGAFYYHAWVEVWDGH
ncbi:MAG: transglutaminase-like domain-containing protein, partial [Fimbriimonadaceae bacterium]